MLPPTSAKEPLPFLIEVMNDGEVPLELRIKAASTAAQYMHAKKGDSGKKEERQKAAEAAARLYAPIEAPTLKVVGKR